MLKRVQHDIPQAYVTPVLSISNLSHDEYIQPLIIHIIMKKFVIFLSLLVLNNLAYASSNKVKVKAASSQDRIFFKEFTVPGECKILMSKDYVADSSGVVDFVLRTKDDVKKGALVLAIDKKLSEAHTNQSYLEYESARSSYERDKTLLDKKIITQDKFERTKVQYHAAKSKYEESLKSNDSRMIYAPFDGIVSAIKFKEGETVKTGDFLFSIVSGNQKFIRFEIPQIYDVKKENLKAKIKTKIEANNMEARNIEEIEIENIEISNHLSEHKTGYVSTAKILKPNNIKHNSFVRISIEFDIHNGIGVPESAIFMQDGKHHIFIVDENNESRLMVVKVGDRNHGFIEILSGKLKLGDKVVIEGIQKIEDGQKIEIVE